MDIVEDEDLIAARQSARTLAAEIGFSSMEQAMIAAVVTELASNILDHAGRGELVLHAVEDSGRRGIVIIARDRGPGIRNVKQAMHTSYSVAAGLGGGLRGVKGLMDSLDVISGSNSGTTVTAKKWK
jgi:serine/threonine-protein kinase RsbT